MRAAPALLAGATVALGITRRWLESRQADAGPGPGHEPAVARRLAHWVPTAPRTEAGRHAATAWAAPLTTIGALLAMAGRATPRWDPVRECWVATGVGGPSRLLLGALGLSANTVGHVVLVCADTASDRLLDHEAVHVRQGERLGPLLPILYAVCSAAWGYRDNPLERAARRGAAARQEQP